MCDEVQWSYFRVTVFLGSTYMNTTVMNSHHFLPFLRLLSSLLTESLLYSFTRYTSSLRVTHLRYMFHIYVTRYTSSLHVTHLHYTSHIFVTRHTSSLHVYFIRLLYSSTSIVRKMKNEKRIKKGGAWAKKGRNIQNIIRTTHFHPLPPTLPTHLISPHIDPLHSPQLISSFNSWNPTPSLIPADSFSSKTIVQKSIVQDKNKMGWEMDMNPFLF